MSAVRIAGFALLSAAAGLTVRAYKPELGVQTGVVAGIIILLYALEELGGIYSGLSVYMAGFGIPENYIAAMLKVTGIVYLMQFAAEACRDAGEGAIAAKTELAGRVMILTVCVPVIKAIFELIIKVGAL